MTAHQEDTSNTALLFIAVSLPYLTEAIDMHAFPGLDMARRALLLQMQVYCHAFRPHLETMCSEKRRHVPKGHNTSNAPAVSGNADISDSEGEGMNLISVTHASHGSPC